MQEEASRKELTDTGGINYDQLTLRPTQELEYPMGRASALSQSIDPTSSTLRVQQSANRNILMFNSLEKRHDSLNPILSFVLLRNAFL